MVIDLARLPGVFFEAPPPRRLETLPRMDVAAFVGFAAAGPLDVPVAIESPHRFRDLFGPEVRLGWDADRGEFRTGHLGRSVEAFFANGGRRCWIVRVANSGAVARHEFEIPGLIASADRLSSPVVPARAASRAPGSWCEDLRTGAVLNRDPLPLQALALAPGAYRLDLSVDAGRVQVGDAIEITFGRGRPVLILFASTVTPIAGGLRVSSATSLSGGETEGVFWHTPPAAVPAGSGIDLETLAPTALGEAAGIAAAQAALASPPARPVARRLSFELLVFKGEELSHTLGNLAFCSRHPRFWGALPTDDDLFRQRYTEPVSPEPTGLAREAAAPRFPIAGPPGVTASGTGTANVRYYLPWGMGRSRMASRARPLPPDTSGTTALERDGLGVFAAELFLHRGLARLYSGSLLAEGQYLQSVAGLPLSGLHCLLSIEDVSLVAVPDAVHRGWTRELPPSSLPLGAPNLDPIADPDTAGRYPLSWSSVAGADTYVVQRDVDPGFVTAVVAFEDAGESAAVKVPAGCPRDLFFRVRAVRDGEIGPWSNTREAHLPREDFLICERQRPAALVLAFTGDLGSPGPLLDWQPEDPSAPMPAGWELVEATDAAFAGATAAIVESASAGIASLPRRRSSARYYRIRGLANGIAGVWSNTVRVPATERAAFTEFPEDAFDPTSLLAIHRSLLRFAAARGDLLALLSLPDHYREPEALAHTALLTPGGPEEDPAPTAPSGSLRVPPLTEGEQPLLSFGALYHPWLLGRAAAGRGDLDRPIRLSPPDGAVAGLMASVASNDGAWIAPANRPIAGSLGLHPPLGPGAWQRLVPAGVNVILDDARGFLTKSEDTLGGERGLQRVHVRRLMILLRRLALREGERFVFEPYDSELRRTVRLLFERMLSELYQRGAFQGRDATEAFAVITDERVNRPTSMDRGQLFVELRVAPAAALAYLTVRLVTSGPAGLAVVES